VDATGFDTSPRRVLRAPLAGLTLEPKVPGSAPGFRCDAPSGAPGVVAQAGVYPAAARYCIAVDGHLSTEQHWMDDESILIKLAEGSYAIVPDA
jgi:hypothetical protein